MMHARAWHAHLLVPHKQTETRGKHRLVARATDQFSVGLFGIHETVYGRATSWRARHASRRRRLLLSDKHKHRRARRSLRTHELSSDPRSYVGARVRQPQRVATDTEVIYVGSAHVV